jgi:gamma-glutamyl-gamma-aminobutyrate hydrolase PuuD
LPFGIGTPEAKRGSYRLALESAGLQPVEDVGTLDGLDGLMLAGGTDIDPALYGAAKDERTDEPDVARDKLEALLLRQALERDVPVFGICRGLQVMNVALGGTLRQHVEGHKYPKVREVHRVSIVKNSRLESILGQSDYVVNSRHHQCAHMVPARLQVTASAPDGVVEALELPGHRFVMAVQWRPEARIDTTDFKLFEAFAVAVRSVR